MKTNFVKYERKDNKDLCEITLENDAGMAVKVLNYGATLEKVLLDGENMILSLNSPEDYSKERNFLGGTVGRIAGRVRAGQWKHGNEIHQLPLNDGDNHIHGGIGTDMHVWDFRPSCDSEHARVDLTLFDPDGNNDYPGNLKLHARYELDNENNLHYLLEAVSDKLTIFNPVNHTYFNLGERAEDLNLQMNADYYLPVDEAGLPDRGMAEVAGTAFDFRKTKRIGDALNSDDSQIKLRNGLDHPFILNGNNPAALLSSNKHRLIVKTNAPALVLYAGNHFNHTGIVNNIGQYDGITFEAQCPPAEGNDLGQITLLPFEKFKRTVDWKFE
ncbi:aldose epimerase family protein [Lactobacillus acidophilus]|uniref:aldose epimerase family protein n=1 Tax=Lactobacillus acidophilus TaxID=1579 RepID=UPI000300662D|nr:aldose epimerase family protein [Lactobacillus acidophilus]AVW87195.1 galactose mutarotase [Lactobacillus acidophilus]KHE29771.1 aldose epimerase [Lactobacillus acidophilus]KRK28641.1 galactose-1-epimerase [Lactobacillus acidophilus DSM 20079 = JCM 1132 = NBRC 13951 = CIP 76.13]MBA4558039.1 galactose mutarotase [Lactobacillus acidophilus]MBN3462528.1 galactose mutarotase [Lactobacillus acidophilus]